MSNGWKWELSEWGDETTRLVFWDSMHGHDILIILKEDGTAWLSEILDEDSDEETLIQIDLVKFLREHASPDWQDN